MEAAPDRYRFILERPIVGEPGVKWSYCGGATALLGHLIEKGTEDIFRKIRKDFDDKGVSVSDAELRKAISDFMTAALAQIQAEAKS